MSWICAATPTVDVAQNITSPTNPAEVTRTWLLPLPRRVPNWKLVLACPFTSVCPVIWRPFWGYSLNCPSILFMLKVTGTMTQGYPTELINCTTRGIGTDLPLSPDCALPETH